MSENKEQIFVDILSGMPMEKDLQAAGHEIYEFCKAISNDGIADRGAGFDVYDIWFKYGGAEIFLTLKAKP